MTMLARLDDIMHAAIMVFCLISSLYFLFQKCDEQAPIRLRHALGTIMLVIAIQSSLYFVGSFGLYDALVTDKKLVVLVNLQVVPFCILMLAELTRMTELTLKRFLSHSVPVVVSLLVYVVLKYVNQMYADVIYYVILIQGLVYITLYTIRFLKAAKRYNKAVADVYADLDGRSINWLGRCIGLMLLLVLIFAVLKVVIYGYYDNRVVNMVFLFLTLIVFVDLCWNIDQMRMIESIPYGDEQAAVLEESEDAEEEETQHVETGEGRVLTAEQKEFMEQLDIVCTEGNLYSMHGITREDVAKAMMTNHIRLTKLLKEATGLTFNAYITKIRLDQAARMLLETNDTIEQIFYTCGYRTRSTFNRAFTDAFGCTPKEYRSKAEH